MRIMFPLKSWILAFILTWRASFSYEWPSYIRRCSQNDSDFNKCILAAGKQVIPLLAFGVKEWGIKSFDPWRFGNLTFTSFDPSVKIVFQIREGEIRNATRIAVEKLRYDRTRRELQLEGIHRKVRMIGRYQSFGEIHSLQFISKGNFNFELGDVFPSYGVKLTPSKDRKGYYDPHFIYKLRSLRKLKIYLNDENLSSSAEELIERTANENWQQIVKAVKPSIERGLSQLFEDSIRPLFRRFPIKTIFPEYNSSS